MVAARPADEAACLLAQAREAERNGYLVGALERARGATLADPLMPAAWFVLGVV